MAGVADLIVVTGPPGAGKTTVARVQHRADRGSRDLEAARHMYQEFATADVDPRHVVVTAEDATTLASHLRHLVQEGSLRRTIMLTDLP